MIKPWFEDGFDGDLESFIKSKWKTENHTLACQDESLKWSSLLLEYNPDLDIEIHEGFYYVRGDLDCAEGHTWIVVDGCIFDPTADQFKGKPSYDLYDTHIYYDGDSLLKHLAFFGMLPKKREVILDTVELTIS